MWDLFFEKYKNACKYSKTLIFWFGTEAVMNVRIGGCLKNYSA
jgi:hypothetical protein